MPVWKLLATWLKNFKVFHNWRLVNHAVITLITFNCSNSIKFQIALLHNVTLQSASKQNIPNVTQIDIIALWRSRASYSFYTTTMFCLLCLLHIKYCFVGVEEKTNVCLCFLVAVFNSAPLRSVITNK